MAEKWHIFHVRNRTPLYADLAYGGIAYGGVGYKIFNGHSNLYQIDGAVCVRLSEFNKRKAELLAVLEKYPNFVMRIMAKHYVRSKIYQTFWDTLLKFSYDKLSNKRLAGYFEKYAKSIKNFWSIGLIPLYVEDNLTKQVENYIKSVFLADQADKALQIFMTPIKEGVLGKEYKSLLKIAIAPKAKREKLLEQHTTKFGWMKNQLYTHSFFTANDYQKRLNDLLRANPRKKFEIYNKERAHLKSMYQFLLKTVQPNKRMRAIIETLNEAIYYRSWRGELPYYSGYMVCKMLEEIALRLRLSVKELLHCTSREIIAWLRQDKPISKSVLKERQRKFVYIPTKAGKIVIGLAVDKWKAKIADRIDNKKQVVGKCACPGKVRGVAKVVIQVNELDKISDGDILIASSTTPLYVSVLSKVRAIITDEGGVLSHASVISREMKIPCIIGTKFATQIFKDDDMVEVDAEKGIVRKI